MLRLNGDMKSSTADLSIGEVAQRFGLATHVLRHWESMGLLSPARATASRRRYGSDDIYRVAVILRAKEAGFGLEDIRELFDARDPATRTGLLRRHRTELAARIAAAQASLELIDCALDCDHEDIVSCPHFQAAVTARINPPSAPNALT
ncbi:Putative MerR family transcriptional regulator [Amycolatopsis japonica]|uniref:Putative MerR family transcriptional regulator n=2 Tax=Amycolatopsis japonica TaxID=208439 RepID=A0A075VC62_9PSEU|nr:Putative MerR family transcriptional regulator [Amycolatopsis japonica]